MSRALGLLFLLSVLNLACAMEGDLLPVKVDVTDKASLQRGARLYMNYCSGCHSLQYLRYNQMAKDLGLLTFDGEVDTDLLVNNLIFTHAKIQDPIRISLIPEDALQWFGRVPPDLTLITRIRSPEWVYTYLKSFYRDKKRPFGTNNLLYPDVAMPNVLAPLAGNYELSHHQGSRLVLVDPGSMSSFEFDSALEDLVTFLCYAAEPTQVTRQRLGVFVILFLLVFLILAYQLKKLYWKKL